MPWIIWEYFTERWLERAERGEVLIDDGDRFMSLWIAFNGWMKGKFGEDKSDNKLLEGASNCSELLKALETLKRSTPAFSNDLVKLQTYTVEDMRRGKLKKADLIYDGSLKSLLEIIYRVRCNLFHGRKDMSEFSKDLELVILSYRILLPLFKEYLQNYQRNQT
jgi:hypothetical protein